LSEIDRCRPWIEAALEYSGGTHAFEDVADAITEGRMQLWPAPDACMVTEILVFPRRKHLNVFLAGGKLERLHDMWPSLTEWARAQGCHAITASGRRGWSRIAHGKAVEMTLLRQEI
jgi:hypothetical protein